jgi:outer membrane protein assembly factor BamB
VHLLWILAFVNVIGVSSETPEVPVIVSWPMMTDTLTEITLDVKAEGVNKHDVAYQIDWGDGTALTWSHYSPSGTPIEQTHTYQKPGIMLVRARASSNAFAGNLSTGSAWCRACTVTVRPSLIKWQFPVPNGTFCSPALDSAGNIYFGDEGGSFYSLTPDGRLRWQMRVSDTVNGAISAAAVIANGAVCFPCSDQHVYALTLDGKPLWSYKTASAVVAAPALGADGTIYAADDSGLVYCLTNQGVLKWQFLTDDEVDNGLTVGPDGTIYVPSDSLYAISPAGKRLWAQGAQEQDNPFYGASIGPDNDVYATNKDGYVYRLEAKTGRIVWRAATDDEDELHGEIVFGPDNSVLFGCDDYSVSLKPRDGDVRELIETEERVRTTPAISSKGTVYFLSLDGNFYAVTLGGRVVWCSPIASSDQDFIPSSAVIAPDGTVYVGSYDDGLYAFYGDAGPLAGKWSMIRGNPQHTGRIMK